MHNYMQNYTQTALNLSSDYIVQVTRNFLSSTNQTRTHITNVMTMVDLEYSQLAEMNRFVWQEAEH